MPEITNFTELKAYVDIHNERGHTGFKEPIDPFFWWNHKEPGKVSDSVKAWIDNGLVIILETNGEDVENLLVFSLWGTQKGTFKKVLDKVKDYDKVIYNSEFRDRYRNITRKLDGASWSNGGRVYYSANGRESWSRLGKRL